MGRTKEIADAMTEKSEATLKAIFRAVFELPPEADVTTMQTGQTEAWDSLATVSIAAAMESEFGWSLDADEMLRITSYQAAARLVEEREA
jgi:acyl carrier protein